MAGGAGGVEDGREVAGGAGGQGRRGAGSGWPGGEILFIEADDAGSRGGSGAQGLLDDGTGFGGAEEGDGGGLAEDIG